MRSGQHFTPQTNNGTDAHVVESYWMNITGTLHRRSRMIQQMMTTEVLEPRGLSVQVSPFENSLKRRASRAFLGRASSWRIV
jgi:hypothetical protein